MPDTKVPIEIDCRGPLDTANPISNLEPGALIEALELYYNYWGPKVGSLSTTRIWESPGTGAIYSEIVFNSGASTYATGSSYEREFRDLGTKFTLDLWFRLENVAFAASKDEIGLYKFVTSVGVIEVSVLGPGSLDHEKLQVKIITTPSRTTSDTTVTITGSSRISYGTGQNDIQHVRLVRDGASAMLYLNGVADGGSSTALVATSPLLGALNGQALVALGQSYDSTDLTVTFYGRIYGAVLRDGAFSSQPIEAVMPCAPHARNVHHFYINQNYSLGGANDHFMDLGRFGAHARISGAGYTIVSGVTSQGAPIPCPVQGMRTWTTRTNRTCSSVMAGGILSSAGVS